MWEARPAAMVSFLLGVAQPLSGVCFSMDSTRDC